MDTKQDNVANPIHEDSNGHFDVPPCVSGEIRPFTACSASKRPPLDVGDIFRKATRPVVTVIFAGTLAQVVTQGIDAPEWATGLMMAVIAWWFGDRTIGRLKEKK